jgi:hypothetical protein
MKDHKHVHGVQPPEGTIWNPGDCRICGKTWKRIQAEKALAEAQAAMAETEPSS